MAQTANFTPVVLERDNSIQFAAQSIANAAKEKREQQLAVQQAILKQRNANDAIFGAESKNIREYYDKSKSLAPAERDRILTEKIASLAKIPKDSPDYLRYATQITNEASSAFSGINQTFADTEAVIDEMTKSGFKLNPEAVRRLAANSMYDYKQANEPIVRGIEVGAIPPPSGRTREEAIEDARRNGQFKVLKSPSDLQDFGAKIKEEIRLHPDLYADIGAVKQGAISSVTKLLDQASPVKRDVELDPTGTKTTSLGYSYKKSVFDMEIEEKEKETGLSYKRPKLNTSTLHGIFYKGGESVPVLGEQEFQYLFNNGDKSIQQDITISALRNITDHNAEVFRRAGYPNPDKMALAVSKNNVSNFRGIPRFVDPFDEGRIEYFQRAAAADLLMQSGKYDNDGFVMGFDLNTGVNKANPKSGVTVNFGGPLGGGKGYDDPYYDKLAKAVDSGKISDLPSNIAKVVVQIANENGKLGMLKGGKVQYTLKNIDIRRDADGKIRLYDKLTGDKDPMSTLDAEDFNVSYNNLFGPKAQSAATSTPEEVYLGIGKDGKPMYGPKK